MSITPEQFEAMPVTPYAMARESLETGDILLFSSKGLGPAIIEHFTHSLWSHSALLLKLREIDRVFVMESVDKIGVRMMPLSSKINGVAGSIEPYSGRLLLARYQQFPSRDVGVLRTLTRTALEGLGAPYSPMELIRIAERMAARLAGLATPGTLTENNRYICSEYVAMCFHAIGIELVPDKAGFMAPADIADDPKVQPIYALGRDAAPSNGAREHPSFR